MLSGSKKIIIPEDLLSNLRKFVTNMDKYREANEADYETYLRLPTWQKRDMPYDQEIVKNVGWMMNLSKKMNETTQPQLQETFLLLIGKTIKELIEDIHLFLKAPKISSIDKALSNKLLEQLNALEQEMQTKQSKPNRL